MALVITLAALVLMTFAVMAFFLRATANRSVEVARANDVLAAEVAATAENYALAALKKEISSNSTTNFSPAGQTYYRPNTAAFAAPQRVVDTSAFPTNIFPSLIRRSVNEAVAGVGEAAASTHSTGTPSREGSVITPDRWNAPQLNRAPGFTAVSQVPNWIYVGGDGSATATPASNSVGRFAYCIYDTSGLLDANHAGGGAGVGRFKGWLHNADIANAANATIDPAALLQWRSGTLTGSELREERNRTGGLRPSPGGRQFSSRRDLLRALGTAAAATGLDGGTNLAPDLTHFTRESHAPSLPFLDAQAALGFPAADKDQFARFYASSNSFTGYRDDGTSYTYDAEAGTPVLHKRFSLGKLGREDVGTYRYWLTPTGLGPGISAAAIKAVFGLEWNSGQERWDYTSPDGNAPTDKIKTLAQVAAANRPPDFFEILKAGINPDSLGGCQTLSGATRLTSYEEARQGSTDLHVLRLGASMIDQADDDNYPTRLGFSLGGTDIEAAGVEDLPYLFGAALRVRYTRTRATPDQVTAAGGDTNSQYGYFWSNVRFVMSPVLFNPHRKGPVAAAGPGNLSAELFGGEVSDLGDVDAKNVGFLKRSSYTDTSLTPGSLPIPDAALAAFDSYRACPKNISNFYRTTNATINGTSVANHWVAFTLPFSDPPPQGLLGGAPLLVSKPKTDADQAATNGISAAPGDLKVQFAGLRIGLTYTSPNGTKRIYDTLGGAVSPGWDGIDTGLLRVGFGFDYAPTPASYNNFTCPDNLGNVIGALLKFDPRTSRFGAWFSGRASYNPVNLARYSGDPYFGTGTGSPGAAEWPVGPTNSVFTIENANAAAGFPGPNLTMGGGTVFVGSRLITGGTNQASGTSILNIPDRPQDAGGAVRPNDGFFSTSAGSANALMSEDTAWPCRAAPNDSPERPVILQRPFRNVAELGHAFRDQPWKSVNFFHETSPDLALLDLFSIGEVEPVQVAGMVGANSAGPAALKSLLRGSGKTLATDATTYSATPAQAEADAVAAAALTTLTANKSLTPGEAVRSLVSSGNSTLTANFGTIKAERETLARSLAGSTQTRTWNLLIDIIAQTGRFPAGSTATGAADFVVGGEDRFWLHAAIDRFTGRVLDLERESVPE